MNLIDKHKRYNTLDRYYKHKYGKKVAKVSLNAGFSCPNKDGKYGTGGCIYCSKLGSGDFAGNKSLSIKDQFHQIKEIMYNKWNDALLLPYFQANSNTYASVEKLKETYTQVIGLDEKIIGIAIATRVDCLGDDVIAYLSELNKQIPITIELGLQSSNNNTLKYLNTCYTKEDFSSAVDKLTKHNIDVVVHIINGLPYETPSDMYETIKFVNKHQISGIKIHSLMILKNTLLELKYKEENFKMLSLEEYISITCDQLELLRKDIIVHRISADGNSNDLIEPKWCLKKLVVMNEVDKEMKKRDTYQGDKYL